MSEGPANGRAGDALVLGGGLFTILGLMFLTTELSTALAVIFTVAGVVGAAIGLWLRGRGGDA